MTMNSPSISTGIAMNKRVRYETIDATEFLRVLQDLAEYEDLCRIAYEDFLWNDDSKQAMRWKDRYNVLIGNVSQAELAEAE